MAWITQPDWEAFPQATHFVPETRSDFAAYYCLTTHTHSNPELQINVLINRESESNPYPNGWHGVNDRQQIEKFNRLLTSGSVFARPIRTPTTEQQGAGHSDFAWLDF